eukprot:XP_001693018.1 predicted protein [Chlamydomonas reinhardtii]
MLLLLERGAADEAALGRLVAPMSGAELRGVAEERVLAALPAAVNGSISAGPAKGAASQQAPQQARQAQAEEPTAQQQSEPRDATSATASGKAGHAALLPAHHRALRRRAQPLQPGPALPDSAYAYDDAGDGGGGDSAARQQRAVLLQLLAAPLREVCGGLGVRVAASDVDRKLAALVSTFSAHPRLLGLLERTGFDVHYLSALVDLISSPDF